MELLGRKLVDNSDEGKPRYGKFLAFGTSWVCEYFKQENGDTAELPVQVPVVMYEDLEGQIYETHVIYVRFI